MSGLCLHAGCAQKMGAGISSLLDRYQEVAEEMQGMRWDGWQVVMDDGHALVQMNVEHRPEG